MPPTTRPPTPPGTSTTSGASVQVTGRMWAPTPPSCSPGSCPGPRCARCTGCRGLVRRYGPARVDAACAKALEVEVVDVTRIARMLERALEASPSSETTPGPTAAVLDLRFARPK